MTGTTEAVKKGARISASQIFKGTEDHRSLGVKVKEIRLMEDSSRWSGKALSNKGFRSKLILGEKRTDLSMSSKRTATLNVLCENISKEPWPSFVDLEETKGAVRLGILWFKKGETEKRLSEDRVEMPQALFPGESVELDIQLKPQGHDGKVLPPGDYEVWIGPVQEQVAWFYEKGDEVIKLQVKVKDD